MEREIKDILKRVKRIEAMLEEGDGIPEEPNAKELIHRFASQYQAAFPHARYPILWGKDIIAAKKIIRACVNDLSMAYRVMDIYFIKSLEERDSFMLKFGLSLTGLSGQLGLIENLTYYEEKYLSNLGSETV
jgi:hypothetical protein